MAKGKGFVMGSQPPQDPLSEMKESTLKPASSSEVRWTSREIRDSWTSSIAIVILSFIAVLSFPIAVIALTILLSVMLWLIPRYLSNHEYVNPQSAWKEQLYIFPSLVGDNSHLRRLGEIPYSATGLELRSAGAKLQGTIASLVRALPTSDGFTLTVSMESMNPGRILENRNLASSIETYLKGLSGDELHTYMEYRSGLWGVNVSIIGLVRDANDVRFHESAVRGAIPAKGWKRIDAARLHEKLASMKGGHGLPLYFATGVELSEWLVQLRSELSSEVGTNVPGQFVINIRTRESDLPLGKVLNPDTLQEGPITGLSFQDISDGVLVCGGSWQNRLDLLSLLSARLLSSGKRVLVLSSHHDALQLASLHDGAIGMTLGKDLVLNPVDSDNVPRTEFVPQLMRALESLSGASLTSAADFELALGRAVALGNRTVADVRIENDADLQATDSAVQLNSTSKASLLGIEALRRLHQGSGARAFYGTQTVSVEKLGSIPICVVSMSLGSAPLDFFAFDLMLMKLAGRKPDRDLVIIIDDPDNLRTSNTEYSRRALWTDSLIRNLSKVSSVIISIDQPHMLSSGVKNLLSSCISFRLRDEKDIAVVSSRLALSVIGTGLHSKARWSARESSFLRTMEDGVALLVHNELETAQPFRLADVPELRPISPEESRSRISRISSQKEQAIPSTNDGTEASDLNLRVLRLLERYEPLTEEAVRRFISASGGEGDVEGILIRLKDASFILEGHEQHSGVSYKNYRLTMKGTMALRQKDREVSAGK
ncbi:MAG: hypothetical protein ACFFD3_04555 [Candidatus Thorarchaeota archaeon]